MRRQGFTILEVLVAVGVFFMCVFAILSLTASSLRSARSLSRPQPDMGLLLADLMLTNRVEEGSQSGDFGDAYPEGRWQREIYLASSNGLYQVDFTIFENNRNRSLVSKSSILLWRPDSVVGVGSGRR